MRLGLLLAASVAALAGAIVLIGAPSDCGMPPHVFWYWSTELCRTGFRATEPSVVFAIPLAIVVVVWIGRKMQLARKTRTD